jgi:hypothetical protein
MRCVLSVLAGVWLAGTAFAQSPPFEAVGRWRLLHTDGTGFMARLTPAHYASTDFGDGENGIWRWEGSALRLMFTDGWDDVVTREPDGTFVKRAWGPGADRCGPPTNSGPAQHISGDPGPPLQKP